MQIGCSIFITCTLGFEFILSEGVYHKTIFLYCRKNSKSYRRDWLFSAANFGKPKLVNELTK